LQNRIKPSDLITVMTVVPSEIHASKIWPTIRAVTVSMQTAQISKLMYIIYTVVIYYNILSMISRGFNFWI